MTHAELIAFLEWAAARLGLRWRGVGHFRGTVKKRLVRRLAELGLADLREYRARVETDANELPVLEAMCRIPISRLYRDAAVFDRMAAEILPERARAAAREGRRVVRIWSAGCASGEEPYTVAMVWHVEVAPRHPGIELEVIATDADEHMLSRARRGCYAEGSLRELPAHLRDAALRPASTSDGGPLLCVRDELRASVTFRCEDLRRSMPDGPFDVVLCRNMLLTYIAEDQQPPLLEQLVARLLPGGALVVGSRETMPGGFVSVVPRGHGVYIA